MSYLAGVGDRFLEWLAVMLRAVDQFFGTWVRGFFYVWGDGEQPSTDETISAWVGRHAIAGNRAALIAEKVIDFLMSQPGHCRAAVEHDRQRAEIVVKEG